MTEGQRIVLSLASNHDQQSHLAKARACLSEMLPDIAYTRELWTRPVGSHAASVGAPYLNQLATATTSLTADELEQRFKQMELELGRTPALRRQGIVPIDIDLLLHGRQRFHIADWERPYVEDLIQECLTLISEP